MIEPSKDFVYDAIVVGIGHAGIEAALALCRKNHKTLALSISLDNAGYLACNPSIGGSAKGHLVREVDALGGEIGRAADATLSHLRMLNLSKGVAVHALRAQVDKYRYHDYMKRVLENEPNLSLRQGEARRLMVDDGRVTGVETTTGLCYKARAVVLCCGVYLKATILVGSTIEERGPSGFPRANHLSNSLEDLGFVLRRFKTGTPARIHRDSVDLSQLEVQAGEDTPYSFSTHGSDSVDKKREVCYLGYTNERTHDLIRDNLSLSPKYGGLIKGAGARYCPSVEDKIVRFTDKTRHPFFLEPEGEKTKEMYVQGLSTGLPADVQLALYRSIAGFERVEIMRDAYAIEYECIDPKTLYASLESKAYRGLFFAGQINGTSGYEEAAAQGIVAGINAALFLEGKPPMILAREGSYTGVLIDDLVTKGTDEPYRMMTSRAEYRLLLRQDNADLRMEKYARMAGLLDENALAAVELKRADIQKGREKLSQRLGQKEVHAYFAAIGEPLPHAGLSVEDVIKRNGVNKENFTAHFDTFCDISDAAVYDIFVEVKYQGYIARERAAAQEAMRVGEMPLAPDTDYVSMHGLRLEAREKLTATRPLTIGQASRISGVTPADINVLILHTKK